MFRSRKGEYTYKQKETKLNIYTSVFSMSVNLPKRMRAILTMRTDGKVIKVEKVVPTTAVCVETR